MPKTYEGNFSGESKRFAIVVSRFNDFITQRLLNGAVDQLKRHGVAEADIETAWVPGSFEIPVAALEMAKTGKFNAVITLGCIIRGGTDHYEHVASAVTVGVEKASVETKKGEAVFSHYRELQSAFEILKHARENNESTKDIMYKMSSFGFALYSDKYEKFSSPLRCPALSLLTFFLGKKPT